MEIERKWLLHTVPSVDYDAKYDVMQLYLSAGTPEVRIRSEQLLESGGKEEEYKLPTYKLTIKGPGSLSRQEVEFDLNLSDYFALRTLIKERPIHKTFYKFRLEDGHELGVSVVDQGLIYAEVEFGSEEEAMAFEFPFPECDPRDVTESEHFKMKNYWKRTRCDV